MFRFLILAVALISASSGSESAPHNPGETGVCTKEEKSPFMQTYCDDLAGSWAAGYGADPMSERQAWFLAKSMASTSCAHASWENSGLYGCMTSSAYEYGLIARYQESGGTYVVPPEGFDAWK